jgi:hypothetical protein
MPDLSKEGFWCRHLKILKISVERQMRSGFGKCMEAYNNDGDGKKNKRECVLNVKCEMADFLFTKRLK